MRKLVLLVAMAACSGSEYDTLPKQNSKNAPLVTDPFVFCDAPNMNVWVFATVPLTSPAQIGTATIDIAGHRESKQMTDDSVGFQFVANCIVGEQYDLEVSVTSTTGDATTVLVRETALRGED